MKDEIQNVKCDGNDLDDPTQFSTVNVSTIHIVTSGLSPHPIFDAIATFEHPPDGQPRDIILLEKIDISTILSEWKVYWRYHDTTL